MRFQILNGGTRSGCKPWFTILDKSEEGPAQVRIHGQIGKDYFSNEGVDSKEFEDALDALSPNHDRAIEVRIHSPGGNVFDGLNIYVNLLNWKGRVDTYNEGLAASIASLFLLAAHNGGKVHSAKVAQTMIHDPSTIAAGTVRDMREAIDALEACKRSILIAYADKTKKPTAELSQLMEKTTWMTGEEAKAQGFVDVVTSDAALKNTFDLSNFRNVPEGLRNINNTAAQGGGQSPHTDQMNKDKIIALLKKRGVTVPENATEEQLFALLEANPPTAAATPPPATPPTSAVPGASAPADGSANRIAALEAKYEAERKARLMVAINKCVEERRIVADQSAFWLDQCLKDEAVLMRLQTMPQQLPAEPLNVGPVIETNASIKDISKHLAKVGDEIQKDIRNDEHSKASQKAMDRTKLIRANTKRIGEIWNEGTNTIDSTLQQDVIMDAILRAFARVLLPVSNFATIFSNIPLRGTGKVQVPYLALDATTPTDWNGANGYVAGDTTNDNKEITIDKRKYLGISYTSTELARQPFLMVEQQMGLKGESLAFAVWKDIWSIVKAASFSVADASTLGAGLAAWPQPAAAMDSAKIIDLQSLADSLNWPTAGRLLFVNTAYDNFLKKDNAFKNAMAFGGSEILRQGMIPSILGFDYATNVNLQDNGENLAGVIAQRNAILVATSPIAPTPEVLRDGTQYSIAVDPQTGIAVEYRSFGDSQKDKTLKFIESNYGYAAGVTANLKRLTTA